MKREEALALLEEVGCPENVIEHCCHVSERAVAMAVKAAEENSVDVHLVEIGGLLHDIGRSRTHGLDHGVVGAQMLRERGVNERIQRICERHVCAGIPKAVAEEMGLPPRDFIPETLEEKIVCHADNLANHTLEELREGWGEVFGKNGEIIITLLNTLHEELGKYVD